jgi:hypothetical protein
LFRKFYVFIWEKEKYREGCRGEKWKKGEKMIDLVIEEGDLIRDRHHPREPKHW